MVTQDIKSTVLTAEKVLDVVDDVASTSINNRQPSDEEIHLRQLANQTKKLVNTTIDTAVSIEKNFSHNKSWGISSDWYAKLPKTEEILW